MYDSRQILRDRFPFSEFSAPLNQFEMMNGKVVLKLYELMQRLINTTDRKPWVKVFTDTKCGEPRTRPRFKHVKLKMSPTPPKAYPHHNSLQSSNSSFSHLQTSSLSPVTMTHEGKLPPIHRYITTHRPDGKAIFSTELSENSIMKPLPDNMAFALSYTTQTFPVDMSSDKDVGQYSKYLDNAPGLVLSSGTVLRHVDFPPGMTCAMHRT